MTRISLFTATGCHNLWDELILLSEVRYLRELYPEAYFSVFTYDPLCSLLPPDDRIEYVQYFPMDIRRSPWANVGYFVRMIKTLARSSIVVIGGGGLIYDDESGQSFPWLLSQWLLRVCIARLFFCRIVWLAVGISVSEWNRKSLKPLFAGSRTYVSVRDERSQRILHGIGVESTLVSDPVWFLSPDDHPRPTHAPIVGLALRRGYIPDEIHEIEEMVKFIQRKGYGMVFLSHSLHPDDRSSNDTTGVLEIARRYRIPITTSIARTYAWYPHLSIVVGMRLHSLILATTHGIPIVPISYSTKTDALLDMLGIEGISARTFSFEAFVKAFLKVESDLE